MSKISIGEKDFMTVPELAKCLGKPKMTLYRWIKSGKIISVKFGDVLFVPRSEIGRLQKDESRNSTS